MNTNPILNFSELLIPSVGRFIGWSVNRLYSVCCQLISITIWKKIEFFFLEMEEGTFFIFFLSLLEPCLWCSTWCINIRVTPTILWKNGSNGMINLDIKPNKALIFILIWKWNLQMNSNWTPDYYMLKQANSKKKPHQLIQGTTLIAPPLKDSRSVRERMIMFGQQPRGLHWPHTIRWRPSMVSTLYELSSYGGNSQFSK